MPPKERTIHVPEGGWKEQAYYVVECAMNANNPVHVQIFYTGFLNGGQWDIDNPDKPREPGVPGGYHGIMMVPGEDTEYYGLKDLHYLKPIHLIGFENDECKFELATPPNLPTINDDHLEGKF
jgi:hypothetical protein